MMLWLNLVAVLLLSATGTEARSHMCAIDKPGVARLKNFEMVLDTMEPCVKSAITEDMMLAIKNPKTLEDTRSFFKEFCPKHSQVTSCLANVRTGLSPCHNKNVAIPFMVLSHVGENLFTAGCDNDGENLAVLVYGYLSLRANRTQMKTMRNCFYKTVAVFSATNGFDIDLTSESYMNYKELPMLKRCLKHIHDASFKKSTEWWIDEVISSFKCLDPQEDVLVPCPSINASHVNFSNVCDMKPSAPALLYDRLEDEAIDCFSFVHSHELRVGTNHGDLDWLTEDYKRMCQIHRVSLDCLLEKAGFAEACFTPAEDRQFQLFMESLDDVIQMGCRQDGKKVARIMHEVYRLKASPQSRITDCFKNIVATRREVTANKNMRFYQDMTSFKKCVVEELKGNEPIAKEAESIIDKILGNMKCVSPKDDSTTFCKTILANRR